MEQATEGVIMRIDIRNDELFINGSLRICPFTSNNPCGSDCALFTVSIDKYNSLQDMLVVTLCHRQYSVLLDKIEDEDMYDRMKKFI